MKVPNPKYSFKIVGKQFHNRGEIFRIDIDGNITGILYTHHALERIKQWEYYRSPLQKPCSSLKKLSWDIGVDLSLTGGMGIILSGPCMNTIQTCLF